MRIIEGKERSTFTIAPKTALNMGRGLMPSLSVTTRTMPRPRPSRNVKIVVIASMYRVLPIAGHT